MRKYLFTKHSSNKLRNTIILSFCLGSLILTSLYGVLIYAGAKGLEDYFFSSHLNNVTNNYLKQFNSDNTNISPFSMRSYIGTDQMTDELFETIGHYPVGNYELQVDSDKELQFSINTLPKSKKRLYIVYDVSSLEMNDDQEQQFIILLVLLGLLICVLGSMVGYYLARRVTQPISTLTSRIQNVNPENLSTHLVDGLPKDEIYHLGKNLEEAHKRINGFIAREQEFTRNASHELRTPLTVIQGATDILAQSNGCLPRPLGRIQRSVREMQLNIETFLAIAREDNENTQDNEKISINQRCQKVIQESQILLETQDTRIILHENATCQLVCPPQLFDIVLSNLLRNSIRHTKQGKIEVFLEKDTLLVQDEGSGIAADKIRHVLKAGYADKINGQTGFGLTIVSKICRSRGWDLQITSPGEGKGCSVSIRFIS